VDNVLPGCNGTSDLKVVNLKRQATINTVGNVVYLTALWFLTVITTRVLGYNAAGTLMLAMAVGNIIATIQFYSVRNYQSTDMAFRYSPRDYLQCRIVTIIAGLIVGVAVCVILRYPINISLSILFFILIKASETFSDVLWGNDLRVGHLELAGYSQFARGILLFLLFFVGALCFKDLNKALLLAGAGLLIFSLAVDLPLHNKTIKQAGAVPDNGIRGIIKDCFPLMITSFVPMVIAAAPRMALDRYYGAEILGFYGNVSTPALVLTTLTPVLMAALLPVLGKAFVDHDYRKIRKVWIKTVLGVVVLTVLCVLGVALLGRPVLAFVYTKEILPYVHHLYYILFAMMLGAIVTCGYTVLVSVRKKWGITFIALSAMVLCLIISPPLVKNYVINGAISVLALAYGVYAVALSVWVLCITKTGIKKNECP
jgi:O-antigen/teichoic acid export membrane protein